MIVIEEVARCSATVSSEHQHAVRVLARLKPPDAGKDEVAQHHRIRGILTFRNDFDLRTRFDVQQWDDRSVPPLFVGNQVRSGQQLETQRGRTRRQWVVLNRDRDIVGHANRRDVVNRADHFAAQVVVAAQVEHDQPLR